MASWRTTSLSTVSIFSHKGIITSTWCLPDHTFLTITTINKRKKLVRHLSRTCTTQMFRGCSRMCLLTTVSVWIRHDCETYTLGRQLFEKTNKQYIYIYMCVCVCVCVCACVRVCQKQLHHAENKSSWRIPSAEMNICNCVCSEVTNSASFLAASSVILENSPVRRKQHSRCSPCPPFCFPSICFCQLPPQCYRQHMRARCSTLFDCEHTFQHDPHSS